MIARANVVMPNPPITNHFERRRKSGALLLINLEARLVNLD